MAPSARGFGRLLQPTSACCGSFTPADAPHAGTGIHFSAPRMDARTAVSVLYSAARKSTLDCWSIVRHLGCGASAFLAWNCAALDIRVQITPATTCWKLIVRLSHYAGLFSRHSLGGFLAQVTRESLEIALDQPFILSARMRGLSLGQVLRRHALRHALLPGIALSAWALGALLGETAVIEAIFSRKGLGRTLVYAVSAQDMPLTTGIVLFFTVAYIFASLGIEFIHELVDPRLATSRGQGVSS